MILLAPDKFKGSLSGDQIASVVAQRFRAVDPTQAVVEFPIPDGGEGTIDLALRLGYSQVDVWVSGPLGTRVKARYARRNRSAIIEMAAAAGQALVPRPPDGPTSMTASTFGVGQLVDHALRHGVDSIVLGVGGSATTDGGAGLALALGASIVSKSGVPVPAGAVGLAHVSAVDFDVLCDRLREVDLVVASDVDNPLTGSGGAAAVFGPQKGADPATVALMDSGLQNWVEVLAAATGNDVADMPGAGAAGGIAVPLLATETARLVPGADVMMDLVGFDDLAASASLVVVGEGSLDGQTLSGKGPIRVAERAKGFGATVIAIVGQNQLSAQELASSPIDRAYALTDVEPDVSTCLADPLPILEMLAAEVAAIELKGIR